MSENRIKGAVICRRRDEYGEIIVAEEGNRRSLCFDEEIEQSTIQIDKPHLLLEDYNEAMMSALIFTSHPSTALLIGLGGSSLVHFLLKALPALRPPFQERNFFPYAACSSVKTAFSS